VEVEDALYEWAAGQRRLSAAAPGDQAVLERVTTAILRELRRRLGGAFTTAELTDLYAEGTEWCLDLAVATAPESPQAWDAHVVADAAFARYVRSAVDYAGGRRLVG